MDFLVDFGLFFSKENGPKNPPKNPPWKPNTEKSTSDFREGASLTKDTLVRVQLSGWEGGFTGDEGTASAGEGGWG